MWFVSLNKNIDAVTAIETICELFSDGEKDLLKVRRGSIEIPIEQQLRALYRGKYCLYKGEDLQAAASDIIDKSKLDFEKLAQRQVLLEQLAKPENYYQVTEKEDKDKKDTGVKGTTDSSNEVASFATTKTRSGQAEYAEEFDIIGEWDKEDNKELLDLETRDKRHFLAKDWEFKETDKEDWKTTHIEEKAKTSEIIKPEEATEEEPTAAPTFEQKEEEEDTTLYLNTLSVNKSGARTQTNTTGFANMGKRINSNSESKGTVKQFIKAKAILAQLNAQEPSIRSRILTRFSILFTDLPCQ